MAMIDLEVRNNQVILKDDTMRGNGVGKFVDSSHPEFKKGDMVWGITNWEEYSLIIDSPESVHKIEHTDVPLSYYTGILGECSYI
ncbi:hypothetical protein Dsin_018786 [Dipteronia sinensis]|uniref:Oxidoreductase N-terminal domain-containing protein n=1 Tax=Dipteronia sinensis TaxID=43782 RepID=A0AAE0A680_9ROSI|nr:hypothetical protein Dsin_018786 [Dipteronia sinensis]